MYVLFNLFIFYKMGDFNMEDLQQLLGVSSSGEFIYYSLEKIRGYKSYVSKVDEISTLDTNIKEFIKVLLENLSREEAMCVEKSEQLKVNTGDHVFPNIFTLDIDVEKDNLETLVTKFSEKFEFYVTISNIIYESYNGLEAKDQTLLQGYRITDDISLVDKLNEATTKAYNTPKESANISMTVLPVEPEEQPAAEQEQPAAEQEQPAAEQEQPVAEQEQPPAEQEQPPAAEQEQPAVAEQEQPVAEQEQPSAEQEQQPAEQEQQAAEQEQPLENDLGNAVESEKNNSDKIIEMTDLEDLANNACETLTSMSETIQNTIERMQNACEKLNNKKQEVLVCKNSLEEFKAKGMDVESALAPLNAQHDAIHNELNVLLNSYKQACLRLGELAKEQV